MMDEGERLRLDYGQTVELVRTLVDIRFKLLAVVPTITGAAVGLVGAGQPTGAELLGIGILGLLATFGVLIYDVRNTQVYNSAVHHARALERRLGLGTDGGHAGPADLLALRPLERDGLLRLASFGQERALGLVYGVALAGWSYLVAWGALRALGAGSARGVGTVIGAIAGTLVLVEVDRVSRALAVDTAAEPTPVQPMV
jgi:hypothetical protein